VAALFYTLSTLMEYVLEGHFTHAIGRRRMDYRIERLREHAIICGFGRVGRQIALEFAAAGQALVVIDPGGENARLLHELGYLYVQGDATTDEKLVEAGIQHARILLAATDADTENIAITLSARAVAPHLWIIARANHDETEAKLRRAGADRVLSPYRLGGHRMAELARRPHLADFLDAALEGAGVGLSFIQVDEESPWLGVHVPVTDSGKLPAPFRGCTIVAMCPVGEERWMSVRTCPRRELTVGDGLVIVDPQRPEPSARAQ
jgi:voltage-gated potassium channel